MAEVEERIRRIIEFRGYRIPRQEQEELRQEVLIQVWQGVNKDGFDRERGFWGFVQVITVRRCIDWMRKKRETRLEEPSLTRDPGGGPLRRLLRDERTRLVDDVLGRLGNDCRRLIELRVTEHMSYARIAQITDRTEQALRAQMYRCVKKAQKELAALRGTQQ